MKRPHVERLPSGAFSVRVAHPLRKGQRVRLTADSEAVILARLDAIKAIARDLRLGALSDREAMAMLSRYTHGASTVADVWNAYHATLRGPWKGKVAGIWRARVEPAFATMRAYELTADRLAAWEDAERRRGIAPKTITNAFQCLRAAYRQAIPDRVSEIPWRGWKPQGRPTGPDNEREACRDLGELERLIRAAVAADERRARGGRYADLAVRVVVGSLCGLRQGEIAALGWDCLDLDAEPPMMRVYYAMRPGWRVEHPEWSRPLDAPKGNRRREQVIHGSAVAALRRHRERLAALGLWRHDGPVFPDASGNYRNAPDPIRPATFRAVVRAAGLPHVERWTPHSLRHTFSTLEVFGAWSLTGDVRAAMARTGHQKMETLIGYMHRAGRGHQEPMIPEVAAAAGAVAALPAAPIAAALEAVGEGLRALGAAAGSVEVRSKDERDLSLRELADRYALDEDPPRVVIDRADARYRRAYNFHLRAGHAVELAQDSGRRARRAFLAQWERARQRARVARGMLAHAPNVEIVEVAPSNGET